MKGTDIYYTLPENHGLSVNDEIDMQLIGRVEID
jgi:hypothetical protein